MQNELQTALFQAFDTLNLQRVKTFSVPPVTLCGPGSVSRCFSPRVCACCPQLLTEPGPQSVNAWAETSVRDGRQLFASGRDDRRADA